MGSKNKLKRFNENKTFSNVIEPSRQELLDGGFVLRGKWRENVFKNNNPIVLELGCGKGEYTLGLARENPKKNYIGIDIKGARIWRGAKTALTTKMENVAFLRIQIELIAHAFEEGEVNEIWLTFPDPQIKYKRSKHRLTNPWFLSRYRDIISPKGILHLKTDSEFLHGYTLGLLQGMGMDICYANHDIYKNHGSPKEVTELKTFYEQGFLAQNKPITYIQFKYPE